MCWWQSLTTGIVLSACLLQALTTVDVITYLGLVLHSSTQLAVAFPVSVVLATLRNELFVGSILIQAHQAPGCAYSYVSCCWLKHAAARHVSSGRCSTPGVLHWPRL
jgi:hypothetical protein